MTEDIGGITVLNSEAEDYHTHTITFSDGFNSVDEMVIYAGKIGMKKIVLTDHSQFVLDRLGYGKKTHRVILKRWGNVHNDVEVLFGVEADILNKEGDICSDIQGIESENIILSAHTLSYTGPHETITDAYLRAIERHGDRIMCLGHLCSVYFQKHIDVIPIIELAIEKGVPFELNCGNLVTKRTNMTNLQKMLSRAKQLYINSDAHTLSELTLYRKEGFSFLRNYFEPKSE